MVRDRGADAPAPATTIASHASSSARSLVEQPPQRRAARPRGSARPCAASMRFSAACRGKRSIAARSSPSSPTRAAVGSRTTAATSSGNADGERRRRRPTAPARDPVARSSASGPTKTSSPSSRYGSNASHGASETFSPARFGARSRSSLDHRRAAPRSRSRARTRRRRTAAARTRPRPRRSARAARARRAGSTAAPITATASAPASAACAASATVSAVVCAPQCAATEQPARATAARNSSTHAAALVGRRAGPPRRSCRTRARRRARRRRGSRRTARTRPRRALRRRPRAASRPRRTRRGAGHQRGARPAQRARPWPRCGARASPGASPRRSTRRYSRRWVNESCAKASRARRRRASASTQVARARRTVRGSVSSSIVDRDTLAGVDPGRRLHRAVHDDVPDAVVDAGGRPPRVPADRDLDRRPRPAERLPRGRTAHGTSSPSSRTRSSSHGEPLRGHARHHKAARHGRAPDRAGRRRPPRHARAAGDAERVRRGADRRARRGVRRRRHARAVVLAGDGPSFCAGADVEWMRASVDLDYEENVADANALRRMLEAIDRCPAPVVARGAGPRARRRRRASSPARHRGRPRADAVFAFSEVKLGIVPAVISPFALAKIGASAARRYFVTGERFDAATALRIGLVHEVDGRPRRGRRDRSSASSRPPGRGPRATRSGSCSSGPTGPRPPAGSPSGARATRARRGCARSSSAAPPSWARLAHREHRAGELARRVAGS